MTTVDVSIERIAAGGDGIARVNDLVVFVPRSAPGDRLRVALQTRKRFARGTIQEILTRSADRVDPLCYHFRADKCGGCQLQQMSYASQLESKRGIIRDSLTRIGKRTVADLPEITPSAQQWRYRHKLTLAMRRRGAGGWIIGLHPYDDPVGVFQITDCPITDERVLELWHQVIDAQAHFPLGDELRASVRLLDDGASIVMEGGDDWPARDDFLAAVPAATVLWWKPANRGRQLVAERTATAASASFAQVNAALAAALREYVLERARSHAPRVVIDAYAGSGATAIPLARDGAAVVAIESDRDAAHHCAAQLPVGSRAIAARVEDAIGDALPADLVLINPPRLGIHERVAAVLQAATPAPRALIYVSCDPATLARDLTRLPRYRIVSLRAFDMFPQTAHVETVCELVPAEDAA